MTTDPTPAESITVTNAEAFHAGPFTIRPHQVVAATVIAVYDDGTTEIHSVARGGKNTKLTIDLSEDA
jgi:hypothetical protein